MSTHPTSTTLPSSSFTPSELAALTTTGLLTSTTSTPTASLFATPSPSLTSISTSGSRHAAGSLAAVGGPHATQHMHGGAPAASRARAAVGTFAFSLPHTGMHIKLIVAARAHLLGLLAKTRFREAPLDVLRERWDGGAPGKGEAARKRARGEFGALVLGRTKKWRQFYGMRFEWVLEECVGAGLVEVFETGSVGRAVRIVS